MKLQLNHSQQKFLFILLITAIYTALVVGLDFLQGPKLGDEGHFWRASLTFSDRLIPSIEDLRSYFALNTPLPFIIFGALEYIFHQGIFAGRLLNLVLSLSITFIIGFPSRNKGGRAILCVIGLFVIPSYLRCSGSLYTDIIASFFVLMGFVTYLRNRHFLSCIAFVLAIASRQYMLAFPVVIATYEFIIAITKIKNIREVNLAAQWRWIAPLIAALSIFGWIYLFGGLAPKRALDAIADGKGLILIPGRAVNFWAVIGAYLVIPELILFQSWNKLQVLKQQWFKIVLIAIGLLVFMLIFPPSLTGWGKVMNIVKLLPHNILKMGFLYGLALLACVRFSKPNLMLITILFNSLIMMKAYPWEKYIMPLAVVFWYFKSLEIENIFSIFKQQNATQKIIQEWEIQQTSYK